MTTISSGLNIAVLSGSTRVSGPPNPINGPRVTNFVIQNLEEPGNNVTYIDCKEYPLLEKPEFCYARSSVPMKLDETQVILKHLDAYVCITPEYNHVPSPGLLVNVLNHCFGSSIFSFKPSAIMSYSAGQWSGTRATIGL
jgi:NAD(P)H-dependent FMN reductase